jgi:hypothetical protein
MRCAACRTSAPAYESLHCEVIGGREITWDHFGEMLMTYEGWQFRLQILDPSEEA